MNIADRIRRNADRTGEIVNPVEGEWFVIKYVPDLFAGDSLSIGVGLINKVGIVSARFADDLSRLTCFYDDRVDLEDVRFVVDVLEEDMYGLHVDELTSRNYGPAIQLSEPSYTSGRSETDILDSLFLRAVPLAQPRPVLHDSIKRKSFERELTTRSRIGESLSDRYKDLSLKFTPQGDSYNIDQEDRLHKITLHFRNQGKAAGFVASALVNNIDKAELRILRGVETLRTLRHHVPEERCGLFVFRPGEVHGMPSQFLNKFDDILEELRWQIRPDKIDIRDSDSADLMADQIAEWYQAA